jgi:hypothetical protein
MDDLLNKFKATQPRDWTEFTKAGGLLLLSDALAKSSVDSWVITAETASTPTIELALVREIYKTFLSSFPYCFGYWKKLADNEWRFAVSAASRFAASEKAATAAAAEAEADAAAAPGAGMSAAEAEALAHAADAKIAHRVAIDATVATYESGCVAVAHSPEHWINYCDLRVLICEISNTAGARAVFPLNEAIIAARRSFERGLDLCGSDPKADKLWESWLLFETTGLGCLLPFVSQLNSSAKDPQNVRGRARVFAAALASGGPIADKMLSQFRSFASSCPAHSLILLEGDEIRELGLTLPPGVTIPPLSDNLSCEESDPDSKRDAALRSHIMTRRESSAAASTSAVMSRQQFEALINKRTYFHVKRLEDGPIASWREYLTYEEVQEDSLEREDGADKTVLKIGLPWGSRNEKLTRTEKLYERCLIVTANYGEFWLRYASYLTRKPNVSSASIILKRASSIFASKRRDIQLALAYALEASGQIDESRGLFQTLASSAPSQSSAESSPPSNGSSSDSIKPAVTIDGRIEFASFLRRVGDLEASVTELISLASELESGEKEEGEGGDKVEGIAEGDSNGVRAAVLVQAAQTAGLISYARGLEAFNSACRSLPKSKLLWCAFADFSEASNKGNAVAVASVYGSALGLQEFEWLPASLQQKETISLTPQPPVVDAEMNSSGNNLEANLVPVITVSHQGPVCLIQSRPVGQLSESDQAEIWLRLQDFVQGPRGNASALLVNTVSGAFAAWRSKHTKAGRPAPEGFIKALALAKTRTETVETSSPAQVSGKRPLDTTSPADSKILKRS